MWDAHYHLVSLIPQVQVWWNTKFDVFVRIFFSFVLFFLKKAFFFLKITIMVLLFLRKLDGLEIFGKDFKN